MMNKDRKSKWGWYAPVMMSLLFYAVMLGIMLLFSSCERRELYVFGNEFHNVFLDVDWSDYNTITTTEKKPDGMTVWFYPEGDKIVRPRTTDKVNHYDDIYLAHGRYQGLVVDYSPEEFSKQQFFDMDHVETARVQAVRSEWQPELFDSVYAKLDVKTDSISYSRLYGDSCWSKELPSREPTGYYTVADSPEHMAVDTLKDMDVTAGKYGDYIPWKEREDYQSTFTEQGFYAKPEPVVLQLRVRLYIRGFQNINFNMAEAISATIAGMSDRHSLASNENAEHPCLMTLDNLGHRKVRNRSGYEVDSLGYVWFTINTFGLRPSAVDGWRSAYKDEDRQTAMDAYGHEHGINDSIWWVKSRNEELRLNLRFTLRDRKTVVEYSYDVGNHVVWFENRYMLLIDLLEKFFGVDDSDHQYPPGPLSPPGSPGDDGSDNPIILPDVEPYNGAFFDGDVEPWKDTDPIDVQL